MKIRMRIFVLLVTAMTVLTLGCTKENEVKTQSLKIGVMSDIGAAPFVIAKENGYFSDLGLDVELVVFKSAVDRDTAMQTGQLDAAMADMLTIVFYNDAGLKSQMIAETYGDYVLVTAPNLSAASIAAQDTLKVGISSNTVIDFATDEVSKALGLTDKMEKVAIPQMPVRLEMLGAGELQMATLPEPLASTAVIGGGEKVEGTLDLLLKPGVFIATETAMDEKAEALKKVYQGYNQAVVYINETEQSEYIQLFVDQLGFPPVLMEVYDFPTLNPAAVSDQATFERVLAWMQEKALTESVYTFDALSTDAFLSK